MGTLGLTSAGSTARGPDGLEPTQLKMGRRKGPGAHGGGSWRPEDREGRPSARRGHRSPVRPPDCSLGRLLTQPPTSGGGAATLPLPAASPAPGPGAPASADALLAPILPGRMREPPRRPHTGKLSPPFGPTPAPSPPSRRHSPRPGCVMRYWAALLAAGPEWTPEDFRLVEPEGERRGAEGRRVREGRVDEGAELWPSWQGPLETKGAVSPRLTRQRGTGEAWQGHRALPLHYPLRGRRCLGSRITCPKPLRLRV